MMATTNQAGNDTGTGDEPGVIQNEGVLDLTGARTPEDLAHIRGLKRVGIVLVPEALAGAFAKIPQHQVGAVIAIPAVDKGRLRLMTGQLKLTGDTFAGEESAGDVVVLSGQIIFTSIVETCRVHTLIVCGQLLAPEGSERALSTAMTRVTGQIIYYPAGSKPRVLMGAQKFEEAYFASLPEPIVLVLVGSFDVADDVTTKSVRDRLAGMVLVGKLTCSATLKPVLMALCIDGAGNIGAR